MANEILVMGATGAVGGTLLEELAAKNVSVRAASRKPDTQSENAKIRWVEFDLENPDTFAHALEGVAYVFMISRPGDEEADRFASPLIEVMKAQGVKHVVNLSAMGTDQRPEFSLRKVELLLEESGIPFTHLRPNFFMQIYSSGSICQAIRQTGQIALPAADAKLSLIDARDVAAVAAVVLENPESHLNRAYTLTGPQAVDHKEIASYISEASGREVLYQSIDDEIMRKVLESVGFSSDRIERLLAMYRLVRLGCCEPIAADTETLLQRPPIDFKRFAFDNSYCWQQ